MFVVVVVDYCADAVELKEGEKLVLESDTNISSWIVRRVDSKDHFSVPSCHLAKESDQDHFEWISFDIAKDEVDTILKDVKLPSGAFIIRPRQTHSVSCLLALCIKTQNNKNPVAKFLIKREDGGFRMDSGRQTFQTLAQLIENYADRRNTSNISLTFSVKKNEFATKWEYEVQVIEKGRRLDSGCFGEVFLGKLYGKETVAIKVPRQESFEVEAFMKEAKISRPCCKHSNVLETIGVCTDKLYLITEYMVNGNLKKYLRSHQLTSAECLSIAQKIASAMEYMCSMKIVHRDLAARNILVGETIETIKVADFGLARSLKESDYYITTTEGFPLGWTAPEGFVIWDGFVNIRKGQITSAADVWSYAVVLWELYSSGQDPYMEIAPQDLFTALNEEGFRLQRPAKCPSAIYAKMLECWNIYRKSRPSFAHIHKYLLEQPVDEIRVDEKHSDTDDDIVVEESPTDDVKYEVETTR
ncbi:hypothetical protein PRIPAC_79654 [Pristionchus pacificus]|nr:hypothetical protein PRIPAC_79654 [Pristionchus pacificus]